MGKGLFFVSRSHRMRPLFAVLATVLCGGVERDGGGVFVGRR